MKAHNKIFLFAFLLLSSLFSNGQQYGNEWINYNQQYFHFPIVETGVHRIYYSTIYNALIQQGIDISQINHSRFQLFGKEKEVSVLVNDQNNNGILDPNEFIEFYAKKNDGWLDNLVYDSIQNIPDSYFSLFNDIFSLIPSIRFSATVKDSNKLKC